MERTLNTIPVGDVFKIGEFEFIKFSDENGVTVAVSKESLYDSRFGDNNNLTESDILAKLTGEILPKIEADVVAENIVEFETDLLSLDGSREYGVVKSKISLPTVDFYRQNRAVFEKHQLDDWWWLATPGSTSEYYNNRWILCVAPSGCIDDFNFFNDNRGVRPILHFVSSISVSCDE